MENLFAGYLEEAFKGSQAVAIYPTIPIREGYLFVIGRHGCQLARSLQVEKQSVTYVPAGTKFGLHIDNPRTHADIREELKFMSRAARGTGGKPKGIEVFVRVASQRVH